MSIHDVSPRFERQIDELFTRLGRRGIDRPALLVVPDHWGLAPLAEDARFRARLRKWVEAGCEVFVHGWYHRDTGAHDAGLARFKARHMTAGEGEFLGLAHDEALRRMRDGRALIEDAIGGGVAGFVAPAWLYGPGARAALAEARFALAEDHLRVWRPADGAVLARGPVVTWASRSRARTASSLFFAALARRALRPLETVRLAVHPGDVTKDAILASIDRAIAAFAWGRAIGRYGDLDKSPLPPAGGARGG